MRNNHNMPFENVTGSAEPGETFEGSFEEVKDPDKKKK